MANEESFRIGANLFAEFDLIAIIYYNILQPRPFYISERNMFKDISSLSFGSLKIFLLLVPKIFKVTTVVDLYVVVHLHSRARAITMFLSECAVTLLKINSFAHIFL